jgi:hypothetical protein
MESVLAIVNGAWFKVILHEKIKQECATLAIKEGMGWLFED